MVRARRGASARGRTPRRAPRRRLAMIAVVFAASLAPAGPSGVAATAAHDEQAARLFDRVLERFAGVRDFRARFDQQWLPLNVNPSPPETGLVFYRRPHLMRWEYAVPEEKLAVSDGRTGWLYLPEEDQVLRQDLTGTLGAGPIPDLLAGGESARESFRAERSEAGPGLVGLRLFPVEPAAEFEVVELRLDAKTLGLVEILVADPGGNWMSYRFSGLVENVGLSGDLFEFTPPEGAEVVEP